MMQHTWVVVYFAIVAIVVKGNVQDLRVNIVPVQTRFAGEQNVNVVLKYSNTGSETMAICEWYLPKHGLFDPIFEITRNGEPIEYVGPVVKRSAPTTADVIYLAPGKTISTTVQISSVYNMTETGNYIIQYKMNAEEVLFIIDNALTRNMMSSNDNQQFLLQSVPIVVFAVGRPNPLLEQDFDSFTQTKALTPSYTSCTTVQSTSIRSAITAAENYARDAMQHLNSPPSATARYTTWFGSYSSANWLKAKTHFTKIQSALSSKTLSFDCSCPNGSPTTFAYVYPNQHYRIYLCDSFWQAATTGTDSKGGTIIHEIAHFIVVASTTDHAYGQTKAKSLAKSNPTMALMNSDSLQYFAENNPRFK